MSSSLDKERNARETLTPPSSPAERRFHEVNRVAVWVFFGGPVLAGTASMLGLLFFPLTLLELAMVAVTTLGVVWGFLGSISWVTAESIHRVEVEAERRRLIRGSIERPDAGQLSLLGPDGLLSEVYEQRRAPDRAEGEGGSGR